MSEVVKSNTNTRIYPSNWFEVNLNSVVNVNPESLGIGTPQDVEFHYIDISSVTSGVINWENVTIQKFKSSPSRARRVINSNDVLLCTVRPRLQAHAFAYWKKPNNYIASTGFAVLRANKSINPRFLFHLIFSEIVAKQLRQQEVGSNYPAVNETDVRALRIPLPSSVSEQQKIAEILDTVEKAIALTQTHINKLKLAKAGLLHDLLTKGIDEHGELRNPKRNPEQFKDSPLGKIPKDWEVGTLADKRNIDYPHIKTGPFGSSLKSEHWVEEGIPVITIGALGEGKLECSELLYITETKAKSLSAYALKEGDLVFSRVADVGRSAVISKQEHGWIMSSNLMRISLNKLVVLSKFAYLNLVKNEKTREQIRRFVNAGGREVANTNILESLSFCWASLHEQHKIIKYLDTYDNQINSKQTRLEKLKLLKLGLMSDLLTGKVRVKI